MTEAQREIWAWAWEVDRHRGQWSEEQEIIGEGDRYVRADAIPLSDALAIPEVAALVDAVDRLPSGTWEVWTSNSYRRITASHDGRHGPDGGVLHGTIQRSDGHPDLSMSADQLQAICDLVNGVRALRKIEEGRG